MANYKFKKNDRLLYIGDNDQWANMDEIAISAVTKYYYVIRYSWTNGLMDKKTSSTKIEHDHWLLKTFILETLTARILYGKK